MPRLPFDPIDEAARQWASRWSGVPAMHAVTSLMRVQQLVIGRLDAILKPHGLTFARYEALVLLTFSSRGSLPLGKMGERLQVHPTSVTSIVRKLEADGHVVATARTPRTAGRCWPRSRRPGARSCEAATADLVGADFGLGVLDDDDARPALGAAAAGAPGRRRLLSAKPAQPCWRMATADDVRRIGLALPRTYERQVRGRWKLKVKQLVYVAFSRDEEEMGFGFPKAERDGLIASDPRPSSSRRPPTCATSGSAPTCRASTRTRCGSW